MSLENMTISEQFRTVMAEMIDLYNAEILEKDGFMSERSDSLFRKIEDIKEFLYNVETDIYVDIENTTIYWKIVERFKEDNKEIPNKLMLYNCIKHCTWDEKKTEYENIEEIYQNILHEIYKLKFFNM